LRPDAIFCTHCPAALGVLHAFRACGLETPYDIAFAIFDELTVDELFQPSITTIVQPSYETGSDASEALLKRICGESFGKEPITIRLPAILKIRESSHARTPGNTVIGMVNVWVH
jgi:DNA-binding LacI/PurR family transcriptional regulator